MNLPDVLMTFPIEACSMVILYLFTDLLAKKYKVTVPTHITMGIGAITTWTLTSFDLTFLHVDTSTCTMILLLLFITVSCFVLARHLNAGRSKEIQVDQKYEIVNVKTIGYVAAYVRKFPQFYKFENFKDHNTTLLAQRHFSNGGLSDYDYQATVTCLPENVNVDFNDTNYSMSGTIMFSTKRLPHANPEKNGEFLYEQITIRSAVSISKLIEYVATVTARMSVQTVKCTGTVPCNPKELKVIFQNGEKLDLDTQEKKYIDTIFNPYVNVIWKSCRAMIEDPEYFTSNGTIPRLGYILWGPPGTGKSSLAYRLAMATSKNLVCLDLSAYSTKDELRTAIIPRSGDVIVFDEFDKALKKMIESSQRVYGHTNKKNMDVISVSSDSSDICQEKCIDIVPKGLVPSDLLDIIQGSMPLVNTIIIATTNDIEFIQKCCPALIRPGRLTPYYFGHFDKVTFDRFTMFHFGKCAPATFTAYKDVCPAAISEFTMQTKCINGDFRSFLELIEGARS